MLNSSLFYEISVLRPYAEKILREVPDTRVRVRRGAGDMLKFLDNFVPIAARRDPARRRSCANSSAAAVFNISGGG